MGCRNLLIAGGLGLLVVSDVVAKERTLEVDPSSEHQVITRSRESGERDLLQIARGESSLLEAWIYTKKSNGEEVWYEAGKNESRDSVELDGMVIPSSGLELSVPKKGKYSLQESSQADFVGHSDNPLLGIPVTDQDGETSYIGYFVFVIPEGNESEQLARDVYESNQFQDLVFYIGELRDSPISNFTANCDLPGYAVNFNKEVLEEMFAAAVDSLYDMHSGPVELDPLRFTLDHNTLDALDDLSYNGDLIVFVDQVDKYMHDSGVQSYQRSGFYMSPVVE